MKRIIFDKDKLAESCREIETLQKELKKVKREKSGPSVLPNFKNRHYLRRRKQITDAMKAQQVPRKDLYRFVLAWVAAKEGLEVDKLLPKIVWTYNRWGAAWAAYKFYFPKAHSFDWLPETGQLLELGPAVFVKGKMKPVNMKFKPLLKARFRRLRSVPEGLEPITLLKPPYRDLSKLDIDASGISLEEELALLTSSSRIRKV